MITTKYTEIYESALRAHFEAMPYDVSELEAVAEAAFDAAPTSYEKKASVYNVIADGCRVRLFRGYPLAFEMESGRNRYDWGLGSRLGLLMNRRCTGEWYGYADGGYGALIAELRDAGIFHGWSPVGRDHHCLGYENILRYGYNGLREKILTQLEKPGRGEAFLRAALTGCDAMIRLAARFADEARSLAASESNPEYAAEYLAIAEVMSNAPANPPRNFREALNTIVFSREITGTMEGLGISTFGHLDRILIDFYENDIASGRYTREEARAQAKRLIHALLAYTELRFDKDNGQHETSTTIYIGGTTPDGRVIDNDLTRLFIDCYTEGHYFGTKLIARITSEHSKDYADMLAKFIAGGFNTLVIQNDEVLVDAHVRQGKAIEDARKYVGGGCHEVVLGGCEVHSRADSWVNVPGILLRTMKKREYEDYADFYVNVIAEVRAVHDYIAAAKNKFERLWSKYDPNPLASLTVDDCISRRLDMTEGGARYNSVSLSMSGAATFIDSVYAVREAVWGEEPITTYGELMAALDADFVGYESLRAKLLAYPKFGGANRIDEAFADRLLRDLAACAGQPNARGGHFVPAFYPHSIYHIFGEGMGATPDGRRKGEVTSRGISPSEWTEAAVTDAIGMLGSLDLAMFDDSFVCDLTMPFGKTDADVISAVIRTFVKMGGSALQINALDVEKLREAKADPSKHRDIVVRVCGFSELFCQLTERQKDEVIERAVRS